MSNKLEQLVLTALSYSDLRKFRFKNGYSDPFEKEMIVEAMAVMGKMPSNGSVDWTYDKIEKALKNWRVVTTTNAGEDEYNEEDNGFYGVAYKNIITNEVVVSYRGSCGLDSIDVNNSKYKDLTEIQKQVRIEQWLDDWLETNAFELPSYYDATIMAPPAVSKDTDSRMQKAAKFAEDIAKKEKISTITGHSMGGALAQHTALTLGYDINSGTDVVTFNPGGALHSANSTQYAKFTSGQFDNIINHIVDGDAVGDMASVINSVIDKITPYLNIPVIGTAMVTFAKVFEVIDDFKVWPVVGNIVGGYIDDLQAKNPAAFEKAVTFLATAKFRDRFASYVLRGIQDENYRNRLMSHVGQVQAINGTVSDKHALTSFYDSLKNNNEFISVETVVYEGTKAVDHIIGTSGKDKLYGGAGNDYLSGGADFDVLEGGEGNDTLHGGGGGDILRGGDGDDTYIFNKGEGTVSIYDVEESSSPKHIDKDVLKVNKVKITDIKVSAAGTNSTKVTTGYGSDNIILFHDPNANSSNTSTARPIGKRGINLIKTSDGYYNLDTGQRGTISFKEYKESQITFKTAGAMVDVVHNATGNVIDRYSRIGFDENVDGLEFLSDDGLSTTLVNGHDFDLIHERKRSSDKINISKSSGFKLRLASKISSNSMPLTLYAAASTGVVTDVSPSYATASTLSSEADYQDAFYLQGYSKEDITLKQAGNDLLVIVRSEELGVDVTRVVVADYYLGESDFTKIILNGGPTSDGGTYFISDLLTNKALAKPVVSNTSRAYKILGVDGNWTTPSYERVDFTINGRKITPLYNGYMKDNYAMLSVKEFINMVEPKALIRWNQSDRRVEITHEDGKLSYFDYDDGRTGQSDACIRGVMRKMAVAPDLARSDGYADDSLMVSVRSLAELYDLKLDFNNGSKLVSMSNPALAFMGGSDFGAYNGQSSGASLVGTASDVVVRFNGIQFVMTNKASFNDAVDRVIVCADDFFAKFNTLSAKTLNIRKASTTRIEVLHDDGTISYADANGSYAIKGVVKPKENYGISAAVSNGLLNVPIKFIGEVLGVSPVYDNKKYTVDFQSSSYMINGDALTDKEAPVIADVRRLEGVSAGAFGMPSVILNDSKKQENRVLFSGSNDENTFVKFDSDGKYRTYMKMSEMLAMFGTTLTKNDNVYSGVVNGNTVSFKLSGTDQEPVLENLVYNGQAMSNSGLAVAKKIEEQKNLSVNVKNVMTVLFDKNGTQVGSPSYSLGSNSNPEYFFNGYDPENMNNYKDYVGFKGNLKKIEGTTTSTTKDIMWDAHRYDIKNTITTYKDSFYASERIVGTQLPLEIRNTFNGKEYSYKKVDTSEPVISITNGIDKERIIDTVYDSETYYHATGESVSTNGKPPKKVYSRFGLEYSLPIQYVQYGDQIVSYKQIEKSKWCKKEIPYQYWVIYDKNGGITDRSEPVYDTSVYYDTDSEGYSGRLGKYDAYDERTTRLERSDGGYKQFYNKVVQYGANLSIYVDGGIDYTVTYYQGNIDAEIESPSYIKELKKIYVGTFEALVDDPTGITSSVLKKREVTYTAQYEGQAIRVTPKVYTSVDFIEKMLGLKAVWYQDSNQVVFYEKYDNSVNSMIIQLNNLNTIGVGENGNDKIIGSNLMDQIYGKDGNDILLGGAGNDTIVGGLGSDTIEGGIDEDTLFGGQHADNISGGEDSDRIYGGSGYDRLYGDGGSDFIYTESDGGFADGGSGNDGLYGSIVRDELYGGADQDKLYGGAGDDYLHGGSGNDELFGGSNQDTLVGGEDNDLLYGEEGDDIYEFSGLFGCDQVIDSSGSNILVFSNLRQSDVQFERALDSEDLFIRDKSANQSVIVRNFFSNPSIIRQIQFSDSTVDGSQIMNKVMSSGSDQGDYFVMSESQSTFYAFGGNDTVVGSNANDEIYGQSGDDDLSGNSGNDKLVGGLGNDILTGGLGDDVLSGDEGDDVLYGGDGSDVLEGGYGNNRLEGGFDSDTYVLTSSLGVQTIVEATEENLDTLLIKFPYESAQFKRVSDDLEISHSATNSKAIIKNFFAMNYTVEVFKFMRTTGEIETLSADQVKHIVAFGGGTDRSEALKGSDLSDTIYGYGGDDTIVGNLGDDVLYGGDGSDILEGGYGNNRLEGGSDSDTYVMTSSVGVQTIVEATEKNLDTLVIKFPYESALFQRVSDDLEIFHRATNAKAIVKNFFAMDYTVEVFKFMRTTGEIETLRADQVKQIAAFGGGTDRSEALIGSNLSDIIYGYGGDDTMIGNLGDDVLYGGDGSDILEGGYGNNRLEGGFDSDTYVLTSSVGVQTIVEADEENLDTMVIMFPYESALFNWVGDDLEISHYATNAKTIVKNFFAMDHTVEVFKFMRTTGEIETLTANQVKQIAAFGGGTDRNEQLLGSDLSDIIYGYGGDDSLYGGPGNDTYVFGIDFGSDYVANYSNQYNDSDHIVLSNVALDDAKFSYDANHLLIRTAQGNLLVENFNLASNRIKLFTFSDGKVLSDVALRAYIQNQLEPFIHTDLIVNRSTFKFAGCVPSRSISGHPDNTIYLSGNVGEYLTSVSSSVAISSITSSTVYISSSSEDSGSTQSKVQSGVADIALNLSQESLLENLGTLTFKMRVLDTLANQASSYSVKLMYGSSVLSETNVQGNPKFISELILSADLTKIKNIDSRMLHVELAASLANEGELHFGSGEVQLKKSLPEEVKGYHVLYGGDGSDILEGGYGNSRLVGGSDSDTYVMTSSTGVQTIVEDDDENEDTLLIRFPYESAIFQRDSDDLTISHLATNAKTIVKNFFARDYTVEVFKFMRITGEIETLNEYQVRQIVAYGGGTDRSEALIGSALSDSIYGNGGTDLLIGGAGDDHLIGGEGNDTYVFGIGFGSDVVWSYSNNYNDSDRVVLSNVALEDAKFSYNANDLLISTDQGNLRIANFNLDYNRIMSFTFSDGKVLSDVALRTYIRERAIAASVAAATPIPTINVSQAISTYNAVSSVSNITPTSSTPEQTAQEVSATTVTAPTNLSQTTETKVFSALILDESTVSAVMPPTYPTVAQVLSPISVATVKADEEPLVISNSMVGSSSSMTSSSEMAKSVELLVQEMAAFTTTSSSALSDAIENQMRDSVLQIDANLASI